MREIPSGHWQWDDDLGGLLLSEAIRDSDRKIRLFGCACVRLAAPRLKDGPVLLAAIDAAERFCDGEQVDAPQLPKPFDELFVGLFARTVAIYLSEVIVKLMPSGNEESAMRYYQFKLYRDIYPKQRRLIMTHALAAWNGGTILHIAEGIYQNREWGSMPILADALEEAGCSDPLVLDHCRGKGPHVRACWVIDAITGRE